MDQLTNLVVDALHADPRMWLGIAFAVLVLFIVLQRKPRIQRDADDRLAALRREKADRDGKPRN